MSGLTEAQRRAIAADGDVLVMAGAGTGKTRTLVERCLARMLETERPVSLDRVLMVTFTEAAAGEMRRRIRTRLEELAAGRPGERRLTEQLALVETARISTLHSFCLRLVRDHFHELGIDPELVVLGEEQSVLMRVETLDELLRRSYRGEWGDAGTLQELVLEHGRGWDGPVRELVERLHAYTQTLRDPSAWFERELSALGQPVPMHWERWLCEGFVEWRSEWLPALETQPAENSVARLCAGLLRGAGDVPTRLSIGTAMESVLAADASEWPSRAKTRMRRRLERFFEESGFLCSVAVCGSGVDPLHEDWQWVRGQLTALLVLTRRFGVEYAAAKRELGAVDFHDLEQFALRLLWERGDEQPTAIARRWRDWFDLVFVDEYQDINEAQDTIMKALGREGPDANRFLVGDVKQSIYRFRLANPRIFRRYEQLWGSGGANRQVLYLSENFRSHEGILGFVNRCFAALMREEVGGVTCDGTQQLRFGSPDTRESVSLRAGGAPHVELHLLLKGSKEEHVTSGDEAFAADSDAEIEARQVGLRLRGLKDERFQVWDEAIGACRDVAWRDMAVLLRAPKGKAEAYAKVFESLGLPLVVARGGFYEGTEVTDLLSVLEVLDNPLQDVPLLAVLRSPIVGLSPDELVTIRLEDRSGYLWTALRRYHRKNRAAWEARVQEGGAESTPGISGWPRVDGFLESMGRWRRRVRRESLSACLEAILDETGYEAWVSQAPRGAQREANVRRLLVLTRQFDQFQRQGLFRFLRFVEAQKEAGVDTEPAWAPPSESIRLLSIHQSKGLEFPIVVLADLGKAFNLSDLSGRIILDEEFGLCPQVQPPGASQRYPSLPYWLARRRQRRENLGEELRLLYVGATRARDLLVLVGTSREKTVRERWKVAEAMPVPVQSLISAGSVFDWLGAWLPFATGHADWTRSGECAWLRWIVHDAGSAAPPAEMGTAAISTAVQAGESEGDRGELSVDWLGRMTWRYPHEPATREPAKSSVSVLRRRGLAPDEDAWPLAAVTMEASGTLTGADRGSAHHRFLEMMPLEIGHDVDALRFEAERLCREGVLSREEAEVLDYWGVAAFWGSKVGGRIRAQSEHVRRELPFTARFSLKELETLGLSGSFEASLWEGRTDEWMVVQGMVDLAVVMPEELWILDYKTDRIGRLGLPEKLSVYRPQLQLYARALARIYRRPVTEKWLHFLEAGETVPVLDLMV
jgi:ATP-dependent helicase/nuclease subunit A